MEGGLAHVRGLLMAACLAWLIATGYARTLCSAARVGDEDIAADVGPALPHAQGVSVNRSHAFRKLLQVATPQWLMKCRDERRQGLRNDPYAFLDLHRCLIMSKPYYSKVLVAVASEIKVETERWSSGLRICTCAADTYVALQVPPSMP